MDMGNIRREGEILWAGGSRERGRNNVGRGNQGREGEIMWAWGT